MGLETVHPDVLPRLNKRMTLDDFARAARFLVGEGIPARAFLLLRPPLLDEAEGLEWAKRSLDWAFMHGVECCTIIPTRAGNGAMEELQRQGLFHPPSLSSLEKALAYGLSLGKGRVFADLWDVRGDPATLARLERMNHEGRGMIREVVDIAILGAGFAGALMALILRRMGHHVALLERGTHPRFSLGESSTPLANLSLEEIARDYDLPFLHDLAEYGRWKKTYPDLVRGLKRGFTFVKHERDRPFVPDPEHGNELLVAASPADEVGDTHWLRADFDHFLVQKAVEAGALYLDQTRLEVNRVGRSSKLIHWQLSGRRGEEPVEIKTPFLIDATGPAGALAKQLGIETSPRGVMRTSSWAIYSHFEGVARWEDIFRDLGGRAEDHPYRCDDAALHHVIDEGWVWVLRFDDGVTSAGVLVEGHQRLSDASLSPEEEWWAILRRYPGVARQLAKARPIRPWERTGPLQRRARASAGEEWAMLGSTAYSLDALYSTGNAHALHTIQRLARIIERDWDGDLYPALLRYNEALQREIDFLDLLVDGAYRSFRDARLLSAFAMYYFAGAVAAEERRRQGRADTEEEFLSSHIPEFRAAVEHAYQELCAPRIDIATFQRQVAADIAPWNTVGLCDPRKRNLYPYG